MIDSEVKCIKLYVMLLSRWHSHLFISNRWPFQHVSHKPWRLGPEMRLFPVGECLSSGVDSGADERWASYGVAPVAAVDSSLRHLKGCWVYSHELMASLDAVIKRCEDDRCCFIGKNRDMIHSLVILQRPDDASTVSETSFVSPGDGLDPYRSVCTSPFGSLFPFQVTNISWFRLRNNLSLPLAR
jgi:hypothetical protein